MMRSWPLVQTITLALLLIASLGLGVLAYAELTWPVAAPEETSAAAAPHAAQAPRDAIASRFSLPPLQSFSGILERPLFSQSRRPPPQGADDTTGPWSSFVLAGVIISGDSREALVLHGKPQTVVHLREGQDVEGWTVTSIQPDRIVIRSGASEHELKLLDRTTSEQHPLAPSGPPPRGGFNR